MKIKPKIIGISESRLQKSKQHITNISLPDYVYEHTPTESSKGGTLLYLDKNLKYKLRKDLNIYHIGMIENQLLLKLSIKMRKILWQVAFTNTQSKQFLTFWITTYCLF